MANYQPLLTTLAKWIGLHLLGLSVALAQTVQSPQAPGDTGHSDGRNTQAPGYTAWRTLEDLATEFSPVQVQFLRTTRLPIFDSGGGLSLYGLQLAQEGHVVETVSLHDFWQPYVDDIIAQLKAGNGVVGSLKGLVGMGETSSAMETIRSNSNLYWSVLKVVYPHTFMDLNMHVMDEGQWLAALVRLRDLRDEMEARGNFVRITGIRSQDYLASQAGSKYGAVIDLFGALTYNSERLVLIDLYYKHLAPLGRALMQFEQISDIVSFPPPEHQAQRPFLRLEMFLQGCFPQLFAVFNNQQGQPFLTMNRQTDAPNLRDLLIGRIDEFLDRAIPFWHYDADESKIKRDWGAVHQQGHRVTGELGGLHAVLSPTEVVSSTEIVAHANSLDETETARQELFELLKIVESRETQSISTGRLVDYARAYLMAPAHGNSKILSTQ